MSLTPSEAFFQRNRAYQGAELITGNSPPKHNEPAAARHRSAADVHRHMSSDGEQLEPADLILTNPPLQQVSGTCHAQRLYLHGWCREGTFVVC